MSEEEIRTRFETWQIRKGLSDRTVEARELILRNFGRYLEPRSYFEACAEDVDEFCPTSSDQTRLWYITNLSVFYQWAIRHDLTEVDPTVKVDRPRAPRGEPRPARREHIVAALRAADVRIACMIALGAYAGLRCKDMCSLRTEDIDYHEGWIYVENGKGGKKRRVPTAHGLVPYLRAYPVPPGWLFPSQRAEHLSNRAVSTLGNDHFRSLGLPTRMHQLRHFYGTTNGRRVKIEVLAKLMGHASVATTEIYRQVADEELEAVRGLSLGA